MRKALSVLLVITQLLIGTLPVLAAPQVIENKAPTQIVTPRAIDYTVWRVENKTLQSPTYGSWIFAVSGYGPMTIQYTKSYGFNLNICSTLESSLSVGKSAIASSLSTSFDVHWENASSSSYDIPAGKHQGLYYRPKYDNYKVTIRQYTYESGSGYKPTNITKSGTVKKFVGWNFQARNE